MLLVGLFPCAGKFDFRWDDQISRRFILFFLRLTANLLWRLSGLTFLLEPVHSSESECTGWTNRSIDLTKYHTARALEKLIWFKNDSRRDFFGRQRLEQNGIMLLHKITLWRQRVSKLAASLPEYFAHAFSMTPSPQHGRVRKRSFPWTSCYCILFVHRRGIIIIIIIIEHRTWIMFSSFLLL